MTEVTQLSSNAGAITILGFGEAASAFVEGWRANAPTRIAAYDIKTDVQGPERDAKLAAYHASGIEPCASAAEAADGAEILFSLVTADQALNAAQDVARHLTGPALYLDCNSCAPQTKRLAAEAIESAGGRYVDVAIMAPVRPRLNKTPLLVSGAHAKAALATLCEMDMLATEANGEVGTASAIKLCRSVIVKGMEALFAESLLTARRFGVEDAVLDSLCASTPEYDWRGKSSYALERMVSHGPRRAAEMRETAKMVERAGLPGRMAAAAAAWQDAIGALELPGGQRSLDEETARLLSELGQG